MPTVTIKNNGTNPVGFLNEDGSNFVVMPRSEVSVEMSDRDCAGAWDMHDRCERVAKRLVDAGNKSAVPQLQVSGARPKKAAESKTQAPAPAAAPLTVFPTGEKTEVKEKVQKKDE
jgi:hypothetical protein